MASRRSIPEIKPSPVNDEGSVSSLEVENQSREEKVNIGTCTYCGSEASNAPFKGIYKFQMSGLPQLVHATPQGGTIHKYELTGGKRSFQRYLGCYMGSCKFCNNLEEANEYLKDAEFTS